MLIREPQDAITCPICGADIGAADKFCANCGSSLASDRTINCPSCGAETGSAAKFCANCGYRLTSDRMVSCPSCGAETGAADKFCANCGSSLTAIYRSAKAAQNWVLAGLALSLVASFGAFRALLSRIDLLVKIQNGETVPLSEATSADNFVNVVVWAAAAIFLMTIVAYTIWLYRSNRNLHALTRDHIRFSPRRAAWWPFIPIMNLFKPYQVMREVYEKSNPRAQGSYPVAIWWFSLILALLVGMAAGVVSISETATGALWADILSIAALIPDAIAAAYLMAIVSRVTTWQEDRARSQSAVTG